MNRLSWVQNPSLHGQRIRQPVEASGNPDYALWEMPRVRVHGQVLELVPVAMMISQSGLSVGRFVHVQRVAPTAAGDLPYLLDTVGCSSWFLRGRGKGE
jgi:hypothetical protein